MTKKLSDSAKNDTVFVKNLLCNKEKRAELEAFGIYIGAKLTIFYHDRKKTILLIEKTKLALSEKIANEIVIF